LTSHGSSRPPSAPGCWPISWHALPRPAGAGQGVALVAFLIPAMFFALYFATVAATDGLGWSVDLWLGAIVIAGIIGLFVDELSRRPAGG
jgi:hypothetical protein